MQRIYIPVLVIIVTIAAACKKNNSTTNDPNNVPGLPPATQIGANTFGCLVNGVPWVPQGSNGTNNLSIDYDPGFNNGIFNIVAKKITAAENTQIIIGIRDSLNYVVDTKSYMLTKEGLYGAYYFKDCRLFSGDSMTNIIFGSMTIVKLDRQRRIIAGSFDFSFTSNLCDTIKITNGRFDFKF
ncbi:MAG: hypothetical protein CUR34_00185 [Sediminibacterium sp.]|nr:MAG: hypothetical protein CUR34_00185 [Sediminibacterium sp.] [Sediminibacterium sp. FEMGT703S]